MLAASTAPSAAPAPTMVCISSMKRTQLPEPRISSTTFLSRSSNSPRYFVPATSAPMSSVTRRLPWSVDGTSLPAIRWARASTIAVLPTPGSPTSTGLFLVLRLSICVTRCISFSRPTVGSSFLSRAAAVRSTPSWSSVGVRVPDLLPLWECCTVWVSMRLVSALTLSRLTPRLSRTPAATPSPSLMSPMSRCSVPM